MLLGLQDCRAQEPAVAGAQQHRALHRALPHQPWLHDLQRRLQGQVLVQEIHHRLSRASSGAALDSCAASGAALDSVRRGRKRAVIETLHPTLIFFISVRGLIFVSHLLIVLKGGGGE